MKYMLLIYGTEELWASLPQEQFGRMVRDIDALNTELRRTGELVGAYGVGDQSMAKVVEVRDGTTVVTDGPYIEAKEYLASFTIVDCETEERALEIAATNPVSHFMRVEMRPLMHEAEPEPAEIR